MSIFACIYGFSIAVVQKTQFMHYSHDSEHKEHALSNVCYSIPLHLSHAPLHVIHRICNELQKKKPCEMLAWHKEFWFSQEIPPVICMRLSKNRDRLWQFYTAPDGKQSFPPSHWLQAWHSIETFTQIHTRIREHFHPIGTALANQYAQKPQGLVLHCFQTRPNSSYRKIYCATGGQAAIYSGNKLKRKTRSRVSANLSVRHQNHTRLHDSGEPFCCGR